MTGARVDAVADFRFPVAELALSAEARGVAGTDDDVDKDVEEDTVPVDEEGNREARAADMLLLLVFLLAAFTNAAAAASAAIEDMDDEIASDDADGNADVEVTPLINDENDGGDVMDDSDEEKDEGVKVVGSVCSEASADERVEAGSAGMLNW